MDLTVSSTYGGRGGGNKISGEIYRIRWTSIYYFFIVILLFEISF